MPTVGVNWLGKMYKKDEYKKTVAKVWFEKFSPVLDTTLTGNDPGLMRMAKDILPSAEMSNARWHTYGGKEYCVFGDRSGKDFMESVDILRVFAEKRTAYLNGLWEEYYEKPEVILCGDADCDEKITASDAVLVMQKTLDGRAVMPIQEKTEDWLKYIDADCDNSITASDAALILQKTLRENVKLPNEEALRRASEK